MGEGEGESGKISGERLLADCRSFNIDCSNGLLIFYITYVMCITWYFHERRSINRLFTKNGNKIIDTFSRKSLTVKILHVIFIYDKYHASFLYLQRLRNISIKGHGKYFKSMNVSRGFHFFKTKLNENEVEEKKKDDL